MCIEQQSVGIIEEASFHRRDEIRQHLFTQLVRKTPLLMPPEVFEEGVTALPEELREMSWKAYKKFRRRHGQRISDAQVELECLGVVEDLELSQIFP